MLAPCLFARFARFHLSLCWRIALCFLTAFLLLHSDRQPRFRARRRCVAGCPDPDQHGIGTLLLIFLPFVALMLVHASCWVLYRLVCLLLPSASPATATSTPGFFSLCSSAANLRINSGRHVCVCGCAQRVTFAASSSAGFTVVQIGGDVALKGVVTVNLNGCESRFRSIANEHAAVRFCTSCCDSRCLANSESSESLAGNRCAYGSCVIAVKPSSRVKLATIAADTKISGSFTSQVACGSLRMPSLSCLLLVASSNHRCFCSRHSLADELFCWCLVQMIMQGDQAAPVSLPALCCQPAVHFSRVQGLVLLSQSPFARELAWNSFAQCLAAAPEDCSYVLLSLALCICSQGAVVLDGADLYFDPSASPAGRKPCSLSPVLAGCRKHVRLRLACSLGVSARFCLCNGSTVHMRLDVP
jgi:hypothetical protein